MTTQRLIITRLIAFMVFMAITGAILFRINALLVSVGLRIGVLQSDADDRSARLFIIFALYFVAVIAYGLFFTRTMVGRKWMAWFLEVNKIASGKGK